MNLDDRLAAPSSLHPLGTDQLGRDFLSRLIHGARLSLFVGLAATTLHVVVAALVGGVAGFLGGKFDLVVQRFVDAWMSMPGLLVLLTIMSLAGRGLPQIIIIFSITIGATIVAEASLSFLGFGLPPDVPSWGGMLSREGRQYMTIAPRLAIWPGLCLTIVVYRINMFGDAGRACACPSSCTASTCSATPRPARPPPARRRRPLRNLQTEQDSPAQRALSQLRGR